VATGEGLLFVNSSGDLSLAINQGNFADTHGIEAGVAWTVELERQ